MKRLVTLLVTLALALPAAASAQNGAPTMAAFDPTKLGVSLDRIKRQLAAESSESATQNGLRLDYRVQVYGLAPPIDILQDFDLRYGPVPHSAPSHREFLEHVTPQQFRGQTVPIFGLAVWAAQKLADKSKKARCEQEVENYRQLLMQGIAVTAPRCAQ